MKTINVEIKLYSFDELSKEAQSIAIEEHRNFLLSVMSPNDFISGDKEYDTPEQLKVSYEREYKYYLNNDEPIIDNIKINEYLFFADGSLADCVTYTNGKKKGRTELNYMGKCYQVA